ncbi:MAG: uncharacterized membrane-anchored protein YhcB (DUF1043 family) [Candidatus Azotimanducaceae bacterium]
MLAIEWVVLIGAVTAVIGGVIGLFVGRRNGGDKERIAELEKALSSKEDELTEYRSQVFNEFAETAEKFRSLDQSYHALHRQLATSSASLLGDQATPLLTQSAVPEDSGAEDQVEVVQDSVDDNLKESPPESAEMSAEMSAEVSAEVSVEEVEIDLDEIVVDETIVDETIVHEAVVEETMPDVPTLTEPVDSGDDLASDIETSAKRRG